MSKRKGRVRKATRSSSRLPSGRHTYNADENRMKDALHSQMVAREAIDAAEAKMVSLGNRVLEVVMDLPPFSFEGGKVSDVDDYFDPPLTEGSWFENPTPERVRGFWNLTTDRQVAFRNWCARLNAVRESKDVLMAVANRTEEMFKEDDLSISQEAVDFADSAVGVLEEYVDALQSVIAGAQAFIDGMVLDINPNVMLTDVGNSRVLWAEPDE